MKIKKKLLTGFAIGLFFPFCAINSTWASLIGINYNSSTSQNEIFQVNPNTGAGSLISNFVFDTGYWNPSSFTVDGNSNTAYAASGGATLYQFDLATGIYSTSSLDRSYQAMESWNSNPIPEPTTLLLFGTGLVFLLGTIITRRT